MIHVSLCVPDLTLVPMDFACFDFSAPFKFDISSPDDLVTMGLRSYRIGSKGGI